MAFRWRLFILKDAASIGNETRWELFFFFFLNLPSLRQSDECCLWSKNIHISKWSCWCGKHLWNSFVIKRIPLTPEPLPPTSLLRQPVLSVFYVPFQKHFMKANEYMYVYMNGYIPMCVYMWCTYKYI